MHANPPASAPAAADAPPASTNPGAKEKLAFFLISGMLTAIP